MFLLYGINKPRIRIHRSVWCKPCCKKLWEAVQCSLFGSSWWKENLRMSQRTLIIICNKLHPHIAKQSTHLRQAISVEQRVVVTIWKLASNIECYPGCYVAGIKFLYTVCTRHVQYSKIRLVTLVLATFDVVCFNVLPSMF